MANINIYGFKCDICKQEFTEVPHRNWSREFKITRNNPHALPFDENEEINDVCHECHNKISRFIQSITK